MSKRKSPAAVKVIACLLLLGSLACLLLPWMKLAIDTSAGRMNPGQLLQEFVGMDAAAARQSLGQAVTLAGYPEMTRTTDSLLDLVLDGRFRLHELGVLCRDLAELGPVIQRPDLGSALSTAGLVVWIITGLLALLGLIALICQLCDARWGILPYILLGAAVTAGLLFLRAELNRTLVEQGDALLTQYGLAGLISMLGIDLEIVKMGIGAYLCPLLALLALLLMGIKKKAPPRRAAQERGTVSPYPARRAEGSPAPRPAARPGWTCPGCGRPSPADSRFCQHCGSPRPTPTLVLCPFCGKRLPREAAFCPDCGTRIGKSGTPGGEPAARLPREPGN